MLGRSAVPLVWVIRGHCYGGICVACAMFQVIEVIKTYVSPSHSHTGTTQHLSLMNTPRHYKPVDKNDGFIASIQQPEATIRSFREKARILKTIVTFRDVGPMIITAVLSEMMKVSPVMPIQVTSLLCSSYRQKCNKQFTTKPTLCLHH